MTSVEIVGVFAFFRLEPVNNLVRVTLAVEFDLGTRMQRVGRVEVGAIVTGTVRRGSTVGRSAVESDCPQLLFGQECPAAAAGNWAIGVS